MRFFSTLPAAAVRFAVPLGALVFVALAVAGCPRPVQEEAAPEPEQEGATGAATGMEVVDAPTFTVAGFAQLRWIEGAWQGVGGEGTDQEPFFEGYRMVDDSTMRTYTYDDAENPVPSDSGTITLRGGIVETGGEGARYVATNLVDGRIHFEPAFGARNAFTWERTSPDAWTATLSWPASAGQPAGTRVYLMTRLRSF